MARPKIFIWVIWVLLSAAVSQGLGVNWGSMASHMLLPSTVVDMLKANGFNKVKLFDADEWTVKAFAGSGIELMLAIPNDQLKRMNDYDHAKKWVKKNVTRYGQDVKIKYVAVGNEPFLAAYNRTYGKTTFPALKNIQKALDEAGLGDKIKATIPLNADVYESPPSKPVPSAGNFRSDIRQLMVEIVKFLNANKAPFVVNIYPFLSLYQSDSFPKDYAFFDGGSKPVVDNGIRYTNVFDANHDTLVWSLKKSGVPKLKIIIGEIGWPTDGDNNANVNYAKRFYDGFLRNWAKKKGTPLRPGAMDVYLFSLFDEDEKSVAPGNFERHWGIFTYDGRPKFPMDISGNGHDRYLQAPKGVQYLDHKWCVLNTKIKNFSSLAANVDYACSNGDCTPLGYGSSCNHLGARGNASYAFNMYFQIQDQDVRACDFQGMATITTKNASVGSCLFPIQIMSAGYRVQSASLLSVTMTVLILVAIVFA